ncbi:tetraspanin-9 isoform 2-T2 [Geothlypis trichas]
MVGFGPASFSARGCRSQRRSGLRTSPACLSPEGTSSRGSLGTGAAEGGGRCPPPRQQGVPGDAPGATPEVSRRAPRAAEGAGRAPGRALPKGRRRGQTERVGCAGGAGRQRSIPPTLHPSLPSSAGLEPPLGSAPSSSPLGNAGPSPSSRFRWQELGPCPALPPPLPQHSAPSGPAQGRAGLDCDFFLGVHPVTSLCGCGLLGVGIWLSVSQGNFATFSPSFPSLSAANLVIAIGTVIMVTGFLGCLGAIKENKCLLLSFFIVLLIILLAELILVILFFVYMDKVSESAKKDLKEGMKLYNSENNIGLKNAWNIIQAEMKCCGVNDYTDWYPVLGENIVPDRCCMENSQDCGRNSTESLWKTGCYEKVMSWFDDNKHVLGSIGMCVLIMQILGMAFSMTLFQQIHRTGKKYDA